MPRRSAWGLRAALVAAALLAVSCKTTTTYTSTPESAAADAPKMETDPHKRAAVRLQLATGYYQKGQMETAIREASDAAQIDPGLAAAYGLLGLIYMDLDQKAKAESNFQRALQLDGGDPDLNNNYGWFLCRSKREAESVAYFDRAAASRLYSTPAMALENAGICLLQVGQRDPAEKYLLRAFEADASSPIAKYQLAKLYLGEGKLDKAGFYYELLVRGADPNAEALWLGIRLAHARHDSRTELRLGEELRHRFPNTLEAGRLNREAFDE